MNVTVKDPEEMIRLATDVTLAACTSMNEDDVSCFAEFILEMAADFIALADDPKGQLERFVSRQEKYNSMNRRMTFPVAPGHISS